MKIKSTFMLKKLSSLLMYSGKKKLILKMVLMGLQTFSENKTFKNFCALTTLFYRLKPIMETRKIRKGSKYYDTPFFIKKARAFSLLLRWTARALRKHATTLTTRDHKLPKSLQNEFNDLINGVGAAIKESKNLRQKVSTNIIFSHYRWR